MLWEYLNSVWPDLAEFRHFGKTLKDFDKLLTVIFLFGKMLSLLWQILCIIGLIFIVANGQILKNNLIYFGKCDTKFGYLICLHREDYTAPLWPGLAQFGKPVAIFRMYLADFQIYFGNFYAIGQILIAVNGHTAQH